MRIFLIVTGTLLFPICASAGLIFDSSLATAVNFANGGTSNCSAGPATGVVGGYHVSTDGAACFPYSAPLSFADNGEWDPPFAALLDFSSTTTITIALGGSYSAVWGFLDYGLGCPGDFSGPCTYTGNDPTITALDSKMNVIESADLVGYILGSNREFNFEAGRAVGFSESSPDIAYLQIGGDYIALADLAVSGPAAPEPATYVTGTLALALIILLKLIPSRDREGAVTRTNEVLCRTQTEEVIQ